MLSKVAVVSAEVVWLVTANPAFAVAAIATVTLPTGVHVVPSAETDPVNVDPLRVSFSQVGMAAVAPPM
jgi:hypothetical protein